MTSSLKLQKWVDAETLKFTLVYQEKKNWTSHSNAENVLLKEAQTLIEVTLGLFQNNKLTPDTLQRWVQQKGKPAQQPVYAICICAVAALLLCRCDGIDSVTNLEEAFEYCSRGFYSFASKSKADLSELVELLLSMQKDASDFILFRERLECVMF